MVTPWDCASCAIATPVGPSSGSIIRTLAPRLMSAVASFSSVASLPCALSIRYCDWVYPASAKASFRYGASKLTYRVDDVVSGRITPTCSVLAPLVANSVSGLSLDIVDAMSTLKELVLSPAGIVFAPLDVDGVVDEADDPQPAAARPRTAATATQPTRRERRHVPRPCERVCRSPSLPLPSRILRTPFARTHPYESTRDTIQHTCPIYSTRVPSHRMLDRMKLDTKRRKSRQRGAAARPAPSAQPRDAWPPCWRAAGGQPGASICSAVNRT